MNELSSEDILFINSFLKTDKLPEEYLKDVFLTIKIPPFRVISKKVDKSKKTLTWDPNIKNGNKNGKDIFENTLRQYIKMFFLKDEVKKYLTAEQKKKLKPTNISKYINKCMDSLETMKTDFNKNKLPESLKKYPESNDSKFKDYFYHLNLKNDSNKQENDFDFYKEYEKIIQSKDKKQVYNNIIFDSRNEAENFKEIFQPLIDNDVHVVLHQLYKDIIIDTGSEHSMDFYLPKLKLIVESSSYSSKNEQYYETMRLKESLNAVSKVIHETDNDFNFLLPKTKPQIPYSINKKELKEKIIVILMEKQETLNISEEQIEKIQSSYNFKTKDNRLIEKYNRSKHFGLSKQNDEKISETNENLQKVNLGSIEINKEVIKLKTYKELEKLKKLKFSSEEDRTKIIKFIAILKLLIEKVNQTNLNFKDIQEHFINIQNHITKSLFKNTNSFDKTFSILSDIFNFSNNSKMALINYNSLELSNNQSRYLKRMKIKTKNEIVSTNISEPSLGTN
jgi:hypothetical protein